SWTPRIRRPRCARCSRASRRGDRAELRPTCRAPRSRARRCPGAHRGAPGAAVRESVSPEGRAGQKGGGPGSSQGSGGFWVLPGGRGRGAYGLGGYWSEAAGLEPVSVAAGGLSGITRWVVLRAGGSGAGAAGVVGAGPAVTVSVTGSAA